MITGVEDKRSDSCAATRPPGLLPIVNHIKLMQMIINQFIKHSTFNSQMLLGAKV